jgi:hypothetical protein
MNIFGWSITLLALIIFKLLVYFELTELFNKTSQLDKRIRELENTIIELKKENENEKYDE